MMRSRYDVMTNGQQKNEQGHFYPDVLSLPMKKFYINYPMKEIMITQRMKDRFYLVCYENYGTSEYDDLVLWKNGIPSVHDLIIGETIFLPDRRDIEKFLIENKVRRRK